MAPGPIAREDEFVAWLGTVGLCTWTPVPAASFPNLADMMDLAKPDDIWGTWFWKDDLHVAKRLFYGKLLAGKPTFVAPALLPYVVAAKGDVDPHTYHEQGRLSAEAVRIYEALQRHAELATTDLRREAGLASRDSKAAFENGVTALGALFQICKTGITGRTRGTYSYRWGLFEHWAPEALTEAARLRPQQAARYVVVHLRSVGVELRVEQWRRLFGWDADTAEAAVAAG
jgi:hypothetical protein